VAEREHIRKPTPAPRQRALGRRSAQETPSAPERASEIKAELDELLDEIDEVLEANAEEFVKSYVQKGGQ